MDPRQPPWEVLIDEQDRVVPSSAAPADGPVTWASGPLSSAVARYRVIPRADGCLDLAAVEYFDDYQPQEIRPAQLWADQDERIHATAAAAADEKPLVPVRPQVPDAAPVVAQDQEIPVIIPVLAEPLTLANGPVPARDTFENRLHAVDLPTPAVAVSADTAPGQATAPTSDQPLIWEYQTGESAADGRRRRLRRAATSPSAALPAAAPTPGASRADSRRQRAVPKAAPTSETSS